VRALPPQDDHLMSQCRQARASVTLGFENGARGGEESEQDRNHATRGYGDGPRSLWLSRCFHNSEQGQATGYTDRNGAIAR
jgi:hypothetical protein